MTLAPARLRLALLELAALASLLLAARPADAQSVVQLASRAQGPTPPSASGETMDDWPYFLCDDPPRPLLSADGRFAVFLSRGANLSLGQQDSNGVDDVFLYDNVTGLVTLVSHAAGASLQTANGASYTPSISADGSWVTFRSKATNLVSGATDGNGTDDVLLYERATGLVTLVSHVAGAPLVAAGNASTNPVISGDGRWVVFLSSASDLVSGFTLVGAPNVYLYDRQTGSMALVSHDAGSSTTSGNGSSDPPSINSDGSYVAFASYSTTLVAGQVDANGLRDVFLYTRVGGTIALASHASGTTTTAGDAGSDTPLLSGDGNWISFSSSASNLVPGQVDSNGGNDVFLYSRVGATLTLVSHASGGTATAGNAASGGATLSADGGLVAFRSRSTNLVAGVTDFTPAGDDVFLFARASGTTTLVSHSASSVTQTANGGSFCPALSTGGARVAFLSDAGNVVGGQTGGFTKRLFSYDVATGNTALVSHLPGLPRTAGTGITQGPAPSADGSRLLYMTAAEGLVADELNAQRDVFLYNAATTVNTLVSRAVVRSETPNNYSYPYNLSSDGRIAVFGSGATNIVSGGTGFGIYPQVFLFDAASGAPTLVSHDSSDPLRAADNYSSGPVVSADGQWIALLSTASNLVTGQGYASSLNVFLYERATGETRLVSHMPGFPWLPSVVDGALVPAISSDGRYVAFVSPATDMVTGQSDSNGGVDVFLYDRLADASVLVSHAPGAPTTAANSPSGAPALSADGRYVAFTSSATDLVSGQVDGNGGGDIFVYDRTTGVVALVSHAAGAPTTAANAGSSAPVIASGGSAIAFVSTATNLAAAQVDGNGATDVFLYDRATAVVTLVSHAAGAPSTAGNGFSDAPLLSAAGGQVTFRSYATNLISGQSGSTIGSVFLYERSTGNHVLVNRLAGTTTTASGYAYPFGLSGDGNVVLFSSDGVLVPGQVDGNGNQADTFLFDRTTGLATLASHRLGDATTTGNSDAAATSLSADGSTALFYTWASDLIASDYNLNQDAFLFAACRPAPSTTTPPAGQTAAIGGQATFQVAATNAGSYQWQRDGVDIAGEVGPSYTTPPVTALDAGASFRVVLTGSCGQTTTSSAAVLTVADANSPTAAVNAPTGGEYWLLSPAAGPANSQIIAWSMSDDIRICRVVVSLRYSNDGGANYAPAAAGGGLPATFGPGGTCTLAEEADKTNLSYVVPATFPSGSSGSLYQVRVVVTDQAGNATTADSPNPFYIVQPNAASVQTLILANVPRMQARMGISGAQASALSGKLEELAANPKVQGFVVDLSGVTSLTALYAAWDAAPADPALANQVLFGCHAPCAPERDGIHDVLVQLHSVYTGVKYVVLVGDDRIVPLARVADRTTLLPESSYPAGSDLTPTGTTVGQALAANTYLSDDPLVVLDPVGSDELSGSLYLPDLAVGRLVETPAEITTAIATFIGQDGVLDLSALNPTTGHKVLVTGYDFLTDSAKAIRARWKGALGVSTPDSSTEPVDASLVGGNWGLGSVALRIDALRAHLGGNGGARYGVASLSGHASHFEEGVPGTNPFDIQGLGTNDIYGPDQCASPSLGALALAGGVVYAVGCHGGLPVAGSCASDLDHSLDLPQTMLARGVVSYVANTGYGWGLKSGIGYGERLSELLTEELTASGTVVFGDAVKRAKQRYYLETPRYDAYDEKSLMEWTVYGLPMYAVKTGIATGGRPAAPSLVAGPAPRAGERAGFEWMGRVGVETQLAAPLPSYLTQLNLHFDFTAPGVYTKKNAAGDVIASTPGCPDTDGCYYTLNGVVQRSTGDSDLPVQPYFIYDSRLSGTSQHGVIWKGGVYDEESGWVPVVAELQSNGGDASDHGGTPRIIKGRPISPRIVPGLDPANCRPSDLELNTLVVDAGEALKPQDADPVFTIERHYREIDLEVFYFNNTSLSTDNCDRDGPQLLAGPFGGAYHQVATSTIQWAVPATDASGVWRVLVVVNDNTLDGLGRGVWSPVELADDGSGTWRGTKTIVGSTRATYVVEAVDNRGNVTWLEYVATQLPASGVQPGVARPVDVPVSGGPGPGPTIGGFSPASAPVGATVTINGANLLSTTEVKFGGDVPSTSVTVVSATTIKATVPLGAATGPITVTTTAGSVTSSGVFTVKPPPSLSTTDARIREGNSGTRNMIFRVWLSGPVSHQVTVNYATSDGTATAGADYTQTSGTLTFKPFVRSRTIVVPVTGDTSVEPNETFTVTLSSAAGAPIARAQGTGTILNDDH